MFFGQHISKVATDYRLLIPSSWREKLGEFVYITRGFDANLLVFPEQAFLRICSQFAATSITDPAARALGRFFLGSANRVALSSKRYLSLPEYLVHSCEIRAEVVLVGQGQYLEIWSSATWEQQTQHLQKHMLPSFEKFIISLA
ncbi:MAG: hypothetical protein N2049_11060 [Anaerolineales bacterium]|nr:hypothetical protein [Anaerolineales bacterium]